MPRKQRTAKARRDVPLLPAMVYRLMMGERARVRLRGWLDLAQPDDRAAVAEAWDVHGDMLIAAAAAYDFVPAGIAGRRPIGPGVEMWAAAFLKAHQY